MKRLSPYYPFLLCLFPILFHYAHNNGILSLSMLPLPLFYALLVMGALWWLMARLARNREKAGLLVSFWWLWLFAFGHLTWFAAQHLENPAAIFIRENPLLAWTQVLLLGSLCCLLIRRIPVTVQTMLLIVSLLLVVTTLGQIGVFEYSRLVFERKVLHDEQFTAVHTLAGKPTDPDIYYIIIDTYARADILESLYHTSNRDFLDHLRAKGFYIAADGHSNYGMTTLSLCSSLNMQPLQQFLTIPIGETRDPPALIHNLQHSRVMHFLTSRGYTITSLSEYWASQLTDADLKLSVGELTAAGESAELSSSFPMILLSMTPIIKLQAKVKQLHAPPGASSMKTADQINYQIAWKSRRDFFTRLAKMPLHRKPMFVLAHTLGMHAPLLLNRQGQLVNTNLPYIWFAGIRESGGTIQSLSEYERRYADQLVAIDSMTEHTVDAIIHNATRPTIIIIQG